MPIVDSNIKKDVDQMNLDIDHHFGLWNQFFLERGNPTFDEAGRKTAEPFIFYCGWGTIRPISEKTWQVTAEGVTNSSHQMLYADVEWVLADGSSGSVIPTTGDFITDFDKIEEVDQEFVVEEVAEVTGDAMIKLLLRRNFTK